MRSRRWVTRSFAAAVVFLSASMSCSPMPLQPQSMVGVSGIVTNPSGRALSGISLLFDPLSVPAINIIYHEYATTDSEGRYSVSLYPGTYRVEARHGGGGGERIWEGQATIDAAHSRFSITLSGARVTGTVTAPTGAILDSGWVYAEGRSVEQEHVFHSGRFTGSTFDLFIPAGTYRFGAGAFQSGFPTTWTGEMAIQSDTTLALEIRGDPVTGTVRGDGGAPLADGWLRAESESVYCSARVDAGGAYLMYLPPGSYRFTIRPKERWILARITTLQPVSGPSTLDFDLDGALWSGTVQAAGGSGLAGLEVTASMFGDRALRSAVDTTDATGSFRLLLETGKEYSLEVKDPSTFERKHWHPGILASGDTTFQIVLDPPAVP